MLELAIVVAILAAVAAIAVMRVGSAAANAAVAATTETVRSVQRRVDEENAWNGVQPPTIRAQWFPHGTPVNALLPDQTVTIQVVAAGAGITDPAVKIATVRGVAAFWYNSSNGCFRARVPRLATAPQTLALYNKVNGVNLGTAAQASVHNTVEPSGP